MDLIPLRKLCFGIYNHFLIKCFGWLVFFVFLQYECQAWGILSGSRSARSRHQSGGFHQHTSQASHGRKLLPSLSRQ